ncbi:branched-chain amino acid transport system / permease component family protein [Paraburkholderia xenovorans LB400]|uniref:Amino acid/amide ABC transporter membrane protein 2, HAAT family n=1 Tax=Paraburkholderia xenovorans (strain LB400) TaxID=266265 RepID=Q13IE4_PARXL|nr:branched-chain amino acid ABC transporter permease [Paraburkholderia xenovorans]ABE36145.1 amino acid/amide ABC transporter membrane protein 2, HAAT family [Paraburkholderia xenovorans LB400]AIP34612.1 branched-chain amino acid transport system / permease component family protein [Paraburkholderia xenovorans LB400]
MKFERNGMLILGLAALLLPLAVHDQYLIHLGVLTLFYAVLATSFNLVTGYVGEFSLGHTAFLGIGAYTAAILSTRFGFPMWCTVPLAGLVSMIGGLAIGAITLRLQGPFFVIVTLAFSEALRLVADNWVAVTNGPMGIAGVPQPEWITRLGNVHATQVFFYIVLGIAIVALYLAYRFVYSSVGRAAVTVRENRYVAQSVGIWPFAMAMQAFVLGATLAGVAGGFYAHYISFVGSDVFGFPFMATMIIMVLVGGKGTLLGPLAGALLVTLLQEYLREAQELRLTLFGLFVILIVLFLPRGLMGLVAKRTASARSRDGDVAAAGTLRGGA